jgi:anaerobic sulfite reductase subunit C
MKRDTEIHMKGGVITERDADFCTVRTRIPAGVVTLEQVRGIAKIMKRYGKDMIHLTTRQTIEIPHVDPKLLPKLASDLEKNGTPIGSERDEVVNIVACPGLERCVFANIDSGMIARMIDKRLFGKEMPVKVRISISGCPNGCTSPMLNEIGISGRVDPLRTPGLCTGCGSCVMYCREEAISIKNGISVLNEDLCVSCGTCVRSCPFDLLKSRGVRYMITVGGRRGRHPHIGRELVSLSDPEEVADVVEKVVAWIYRRAWSGRHLYEQMDELQFEQFKAEITSKVSAAQDTTQGQ